MQEQEGEEGKALLGQDENQGLIDIPEDVQSGHAIEDSPLPKKDD